MNSISVIGAKTAEDAAHAAGVVFRLQEEILARPAGVRHGAAYRVKVGDVHTHWLYMWHTEAGGLRCSVDYK